MKKRWMALAACAIGTAGMMIGASAAGIVQTIKAELRPDFEIVIDGKKQTFKNVDGDKVYPILYEGSTYLPIRAIGEIMGKTVYWYQDEKKIELKDEMQSTVTDADVIVDGKPNNGNKDKDKDKDKGKDKEQDTSVNYTVKYTMDEARDIALDHLGLKASKSEFIKAKADYDDGIYEYEFEIKSGNTIYSIDVDANTGKTNDLETEVIEEADDKEQKGDIGAEKAKKAALDRAGLKEKSVIGLKVEADVDDGVKYYEVEFVNNGVEYNAEVRASDGAIVKWETEKDD